MKNIYKKNRKIILTLSLLMLIWVFSGVAGRNNVLAHNSFKQIFSFKSFKSYFEDLRGKVLGNSNDHKNENKNDDDHKKHDEQNIDGLTCGFDGSAIFDVHNMLPGDNIAKTVTVTNNSPVAVMPSLKSVRTGPDGESPPLLEGILDFIINDGITDFLSDKLTGFFNLSDGAELGILNPGISKDYNLETIFPSDADNDYQGKAVVFNLLCGKIAADHIVINEVFYDVDEAHGIDSWKDRGSPKKDEKKGVDDEWVELYNPTNSDVNLKNWTLEDNSGKKVIIHANKIIKAGGFALITKDARMWARFWDEDKSAVRIESTDFLGDGLGDLGDHLYLKDKNGQEIDFVAWENDSEKSPVWQNSVNPSAGEGKSIERIVPGYDTDTPSDWGSDEIPSPGI